MTTAKPQQRQFMLFSKFSTEVRPPVMVERTHILSMKFEEIAESEEEDIQVRNWTRIKKTVFSHFSSWKKEEVIHNAF
ncbi:unnamed protein product [Cylicostephanus goldi]|uniref:Uncharacterized protein n=1 Tax=Cylicostephanus goldi TaxID=71465 RepID=A0A3P7N9U1_CYLGO|nr:unnamed protein product [Cylicostephanus goldi]